MKSFSNPFLIVLLSIFFLFSCQKEEIIIVDKPNIDEKLVANSALTNLITRVVQNPTGIDNVLDRSNCVSINLPVTVFINENPVVVGGTNGNSYQSVQTIINSYTIPPTVVMDFPIAVTGQDYSSQQITSQIQMNSVLSSCSSNGLADIECSKIIYPVKIAIYNIDNQVASTLNIMNNQQFFGFLATKLNSSTIANVNYPISLIGPDNTNHSISSNAALEIFIRNAAENCN